MENAYTVRDSLSNELSDTWISYFINVANVIATKSKDPNTKVGCVAIDINSKRILSTGYNGFPAKVEELPQRWERPTKYDYVIHSEANAIAAAARFGISLDGAALFVTMRPCVDCSKIIAAAGIKTVYFVEEDENSCSTHGDWILKLENAINIFNEAEISLIPVHRVL